MDSELLSQVRTWIGGNHWLLATFLVIFVSLMVDFTQRKLLRKLQRQTARTRNLWDDALVHALIRPISLVIWLFGISLAAEIVFSRSDFSLLKHVAKIWQVGLFVSLTWFLLRLTNGIQLGVIKHSQESDDESRLDQTTVDALGKLVKISILITTGLVILDTLGVNIAGVLAFGGVGGLAVGLAAKDLLANFFGGLTVYIDRPFKVGDWISSPDRKIEGTVEKIGWRQTTIRKFDKRPIYVPNSTFTTITVENPSRMSHRRIYETIGIRYDDVSVMEKIVADVKKMLQQNSEIDTNQTLIVNFNSFAPSSMDFFIYTFTKTTNWIRYHEIKQSVLLEVETIIRSHGAEIAFPTSTLHVAGPPQFAGLDMNGGER